MVLELAENGYRDYNDSHFTEELEEKYGIEVSRSTVRRIRREAGLSQSSQAADLPAIGGGGSAGRKPECFFKPMVVGMTGLKDEVLG